MYTISYGSPFTKLRIHEVELQPFILSDGSLTFTKQSVNKYFGQAGKSDWLNEFMHSFSRYGLGATGLLEKLANPVLFEVTKKDGFPSIEEAYSIETIIEACKFLVFAKEEGFLSVIELKFGTLAQKLLDADQERPFHFQINEITGFNYTKEKAQVKIQNSYADSQREKAYSWIVSFPDVFWKLLLEEIHQTWEDIIINPLPAADFIHKWVFSRLSGDLMEDLRRNLPKRSYRSKKGPQRNEHAQLSSYIHGFMALYSVSDKNPSILDQLLSKSHSVKRTVSLKPLAKREELPAFSRQIANALSVKQKSPHY